MNTYPEFGEAVFRACVEKGYFLRQLSATDVEGEIKDREGKDKTVIGRLFLGLQGEVFVPKDKLRGLDLDKVYFSTNLFYTLHNNDLSNLWFACSSCNVQGKSNTDIITWFKSNPLYGDEFLDTIGIEDRGIIIKAVVKETGEIKGLGEVARVWALNRHQIVLNLIGKLQDSLGELQRDIVRINSTNSEELRPEELRYILKKERNLLRKATLVVSSRYIEESSESDTSSGLTPRELKARHREKLDRDAFVDSTLLDLHRLDKEKLSKAFAELAIEREGQKE
jgi:hypothetical protein